MAWNFRPKWKTVKSVLLSIVVGLLFAFVLDGGFGYGLLGFVLMILSFALMRMWRRRDQILSTIRSVEVMIWGRPLDKDAWPNGEWKTRTKRKIKWGWKKNVSKESNQELTKRRLDGNTGQEQSKISEHEGEEEIIIDSI